MKKGIKSILCLTLALIVITGAMSTFAYSGYNYFSGAGTSIYYGDNTGDGAWNYKTPYCYATAKIYSDSTNCTAYLYHDGLVYAYTAVPEYHQHISGYITYPGAVWNLQIIANNGSGGHGVGSVCSTGFYF